MNKADIFGDTMGVTVLTKLPPISDKAHKTFMNVRLAVTYRPSIAGHQIRYYIIQSRPNGIQQYSNYTCVLCIKTWH